MYKNRGTSWIGFEEAQRKINALKEEVGIAEKKLSFAKRSLTFENNQSFCELSLKKQPSEVISKNLDKKDSQNFTKKNATKKFEKHARKRKKYSQIDKSVSISNGFKGFFPSVSSKPTSLQSPDLKETLVKSVAGSVSSHLSSVETSDFLFNLKQKVTSTDRTSSLIGDTYKNADAELSNIILRNEPGKVEGSSKISFTSWEEEFLRREIDLGSTEVESSHHDVSVSGSPVKGIHWSPVINGTKVHSLKPKKIVYGNMKTLQEIINRQRKFHEKIQAKSNLDGISNSNYRNKQIVKASECQDVEKHEEDTKVSEKIHDGIVATVPIKPLPIRKKCLITNLPKYKGFSAPSSSFIASSRKNFKFGKSPNVKENKSPAIKRIKKTVIDQKEDIPVPLVLKTKETALKSCEDNSKAKPCHKEKISNDSVSSSKKSSTVSSSCSLNPKEASKLKNDDMPKASGERREEKEISTSIVISMSSDNGSENEFLSERTKENPISKVPIVSKSVKRKAKNIAEEILAPSPKIRHYDPQAVRDYIQKKKAERRKRHLEEHKKSLQEAQKKKESLQKLYEFQKQSVLSASKSSSLSKYEAELIESSLETERETSYEMKSLQTTLIEETLKSENNTMINENCENSANVSSIQEDTISSTEKLIQPFIGILKSNPDPFNFINTFNRKPIGIPELSNGVLKAVKNQVLSQDMNSSVQDKFYEQINSTNTLNEDFLSEEIHSNTAVDYSKLSEQMLSSNEIGHKDNLSEKKDSSESSSPSTSFKSTYSSVLLESHASRNVQSKSFVEEQTGSKNEEFEKKGVSPSESSVSEIISVIENSKNGELDSILSNNSNKSSVDKISTEINLVKNKESETDISELPLTLGDKVSSNGSIHDLIEQPSTTSEALKEVSKESSQVFNSDTKSDDKDKNLSGSEKSTENREAISTQSKMESVSSFTSSSHNSVTIDFSQPVRFALSNGVSKPLKVNKGVSMHEEQYFHTQVVTRVASEAAAAAATSAVIAVFETQKELLSKVQRASNENVVTNPFSEILPNHSSSNSVSPHKTSSSNSVSTVIESSQSKSPVENSGTEEININPNLSSKENIAHSEDIENISEHFSGSNKIASSSVISEDLPVSEDSKELHRHRLRKISGNLSSPSPASLSENESLSTVSFMRANSPPSSSTVTESVLSDDSFAQLTLDVVRKITLEEEMRASQQLALLKFQEQTLVENARAAMGWLESLKKNFREKGANKKASFIKRKQKDIILRLRQERAQLRCMQEAYRSVCEKHHSLEMDKKKLLNESSKLPYQISKRKDISHSSKTSSQQKIKELVKQKSDSSSTSAVLTEEELKQSVEENPEEILEITKNEASNSSQGSILEVVASELAASSGSSHSKSHDITSVVSLPQLKQGHSQSSLSLHSNNSAESVLQGLKKLEASKRHLTKREQRILQRRKHVEKILQWQMKLDSEELAVRELEQKAVELVDTSKKKTKYYISSSSSALHEEKEKFSSSDIPEEPVNHTDSMRATVSSDTASSKRVSTDEVPEFVPSDSVPDENIATATSGDSVEEELSKKESNGQESLSALSSSSVHEVDENQSPESSIKTAEDTHGTSHTEEITTNGRSPSPKLSITKKSVGSDNYSESFESSASQKDSPPLVPSSLGLKSFLQSSSTKKEKSFSIKSPLAPRSFRRHDSSGSDDSYTISHSETASDQSDIEVRIHALAEELRRRKYEAEKLKREQKRKYREHLKGTELSLQKQVEAYTHYIQQVKSDLEQMEAMSSQLQTADISNVKPQIKWPRSEHTVDSRRIRKQTSISVDPLTPEKKSIDNAASSPDSVDNSIDISHKKGKPVIKKLFPDPKEKLKHELSTNKDISFSEISSDKELFSKISESKSSTEGSEKDLSAISENLIISASKESSSIQNKAHDKLSSNLKDESEIEEESVNSSLMIVDSKSEEGKIYTNDPDSKSTYQSDSFVSISSITETIQEHSNKDDNVKSPFIPDVVPSPNDTVSTQNSTKNTDEPQTSDQAVNSDSVPSSETEYTSEPSFSVNSASVKDELESESIEYEHSDISSTFSPRKSLDKTFIVEEESNVVSSSKDKVPFTTNKSLDQKSEGKRSNIEKPCDELTHFVTDKNEKSLKEGLKSEIFVVNVVNYLYSSVVEDAIRAMLNLSKKYSSKTMHQNQNSKILPYISNFSAKKLSAESMEIFINELLSTYMNDAISSVINISKSYKNFENGHTPSTEFPSTTSISCALTPTTADSLQAASTIKMPNNENLAENKTIQYVHDKNDYNIFKKQTDWFEDGFVPAQWDTQQLEQQLILQQYPYYYRKIPNKPPPPYTPPAVMSINSQYSYPLPIKKEKPIEKTDSIKYVTKHISSILDCIAETILIGKKNGLMISEIKEADFSSVVKQLDLTVPSQLVFLDLIFDLSKEIALDTFSETYEVPDPWLRPKRLTPKPKFPTNKRAFMSSLQKKVEEALKLLPVESFSGLKRKRPTWAEMKLGRKKRDFVDTILISEIKEEEPDWVNYDQDEVTVKFQIADSIFDLLVNDTVNLIKDLKKKSYW
ncbi:unnamed protein product [Larinioides sclopetarius]|uniref:Centrosome-associated protein 350 n=1 Tax=Larinioides sclopetarius TaxID=280406 RepID=A0AAV1Z542_9ARAC